MLAAHGLSLNGRLQNVDCVLETGRITAICGPNGAGKSTLLALLAGLEIPDHGEVRLDGSPLAARTARERARRIGFLPQAAEVTWDVAVRSLVALGRMPHRDALAGPVDRAMAALNLEGLAQRPVSTLSGGEKARALLARVLAGEPDWILADEPLAALDLGHQAAMLRHLRIAADAGAGVALVVHDLAVAMNHADSVIVLDEGHCHAAGLPADALNQSVMEEVWGVNADWVGDARRRALIMDSSVL